MCASIFWVVFEISRYSVPFFETLHNFRLKKIPIFSHTGIFKVTYYTLYLKCFLFAVASLRLLTLHSTKPPPSDLPALWRSIRGRAVGRHWAAPPTCHEPVGRSLCNDSSFQQVSWSSQAVLWTRHFEQFTYCLGDVYNVWIWGDFEKLRTFSMDI